MIFLLSSKNVFDYLIEKQLCTSIEQAEAKFELKSAKNFNLLLTLPNDRKLLVKQEPRDRYGKTAGEFPREWRIQAFSQQFSELNHLRHWISDAIHFDSENSILVFNYLDDYRDLMEFYGRENEFPPEIATKLGTILGRIHAATFNQSNYQEFFTEDNSEQGSPHLVGKLDRITPEIFGAVPADGLKFFALYQRFDSLGRTIAELFESYSPCCLTHNDLKLNNVLLPNDWEQSDLALRLIDWERSSWGDPAFDLGMLIASYLQLWLASLITSSTMSIDESLSMATTPLEKLQPSIAALTQAYLETFPEVLSQHPNFLQRVIQFSGLSLIQGIQATLQYQKSFGNTGICMLQVAKTLLCRPDAAISTVLGIHPSVNVRV